MIGKTWKFESYHSPNSFLHRENSNLVVNIAPEQPNDPLYNQDLSWIIVAGLCGQGVSFKSKRYPHQYVRHQKYWTYTHNDDGTALMRKDACFLVQRGLSDGEFISFESVNFRQHFLEHQNPKVKISRSSNTADEKARATWKPIFEE